MHNSVVSPRHSSSRPAFPTAPRPAAAVTRRHSERRSAAFFAERARGFLSGATKEAEKLPATHGRLEMETWRLPGNSQNSFKKEVSREDNLRIMDHHSLVCANIYIYIYLFIFIFIYICIH